MPTRPARAATPAVSLAEIRTAMDRIRDSIYLSPCARSEYFSQLTGNSVYLKLDNLQRTGAFKERGALNKLLTLTAEERSRGVIAASAGNHAQGVAYHAGRHGIRAEMRDPEDIDDREQRLHDHLEHHGDRQQQDRARDWAFGEVLPRAVHGFAHRCPESRRAMCG